MKLFQCFAPSETKYDNFQSHQGNSSQSWEKQHSRLVDLETLNAALTKELQECKEKLEKLKTEKNAETNGTVLEEKGTLDHYQVSLDIEMRESNLKRTLLQNFEKDLQKVKAENEQALVAQREQLTAEKEKAISLLRTETAADAFKMKHEHSLLLQELQKRLDGAQRELSLALCEKSNLHAELEVLQTSAAARQSKTEANAETTQMLETLQQQLSSAREELAVTKLGLDAAKASESEAKQFQAAFDSDVSSWKKDLQMLISDLKTVDMSLDLHMKDVDSQKDQVFVFRKLRESNLAILKQLGTVASTAQQEARALQVSLASKEEQCTKLLEASAQEAVSSAGIEAALAQSQETLKQSQLALSQSQAAIAEREAALLQCQSALAQCKEELSQSQQALGQSQEALSSLQKENTALQTEVQSCRTSSSHAISGLDELQMEIEGLHTQISELQGQLEAAKAESMEANEKFQEQMERQAHLEEELHELREELSSNDHVNEATAASTTQLLLDYQELRTSYNKLQSDMKRKDEMLELLQRQFEELTADDAMFASSVGESHHDAASDHASEEHQLPF